MAYIDDDLLCSLIDVAIKIIGMQRKEIRELKRRWEIDKMIDATKEDKK